MIHNTHNTSQHIITHHNTLRYITIDTIAYDVLAQQLQLTTMDYGCSNNYPQPIASQLSSP